MREKRLIDFAKSMRNNMPEPEMRLWLALRAKRFEGVKFRRQKVIGPYIADFAANQPKLIIEIDGETHGESAEYDAARTRFLETQGYKVIRFTNADVMGNLEGVLEAIGRYIVADTAPLPTLSPEGERAV